MLSLFMKKNTLIISVLANTQSTAIIKYSTPEHVYTNTFSLSAFSLNIIMVMYNFPKYSSTLIFLKLKHYRPFY
jgi:hypothetical protein